MFPSIDFISPETPFVIQNAIIDTMTLANKGLRHHEHAHPLPNLIVEMGCWFAESPRNYAGVQVARPVTKMVVCEALAEQPIQRVRGIMIHEMGHILKDACGIVPAALLEARADGRELDSEQQTDAVAEQVTGIKIYYDEDLVQQAGPGARGTRPRPFGLR